LLFAFCGFAFCFLLFADLLFAVRCLLFANLLLPVRRYIGSRAASGVVPLGEASEPLFHQASSGSVLYLFFAIWVISARLIYRP